MVEVMIGEDHLHVLEAVAQAASDLRLGKIDAEFADANGGVAKLETELFEKVSEWEAFMCSIAGD